MSKKQNNVPTPKVQATVKPVVKPPVTNQNNVSEDDATDVVCISPLVAPKGIWATLTNKWMPYVLIAVFGLILNANTFHHEYALDDDIIVCKNQFVLEGIAGIPEIFKYDVFESFYRSMNTTAQLAGGRYRPFSVATFAIEQQLIGPMIIPDSVKHINLNKFPDIANRTLDDDTKKILKDSIQNEYMKVELANYFGSAWDLNHNKIKDKNEDINGDGLWNEYDVKINGMHLRHFDNVILYLLSICCIYLFLTTFFFKDNKIMGLLISLLFLAHPIHTEVVANVKSRDEILSLMFMVLTLHNSFLYVRDRQMKNIIWASVFYLIALMSKEYGASLLLIVPIGLYVYFRKVSIMKYVPLMGGLALAFGIYYAMRSTVVIAGSPLQDTELLNNPYLFASESQKSGTQMFMNLKYFLLLLIPTPLSCDYSYNVIPYREQGDILVILSYLMLLTFIVLFIRSLIKRSWLAFPISFALLHLFLINNLFFNIGATMGERLVYHSSLGICIILVWGANELFKKLKVANPLAYTAVIIPIIALYGLKTFTRNPAWKNDIVLHLTDVKTYPESTMLNGNACTRLIELSEKPIDTLIANKLLDSAKIYGLKSLKLHDKFVNSYLNMGIIEAKQGRNDSAAYYWNFVRQLYPHHPQLAAIDQTLTSGNYARALEYANKDHDLPKAIAELEKALAITPNNPKLLYDIGGMNFNNKNYLKAKEYWTKGIALDPTNIQLINGMKALQGMGL